MTLLLGGAEHGGGDGTLKCGLLGKRQCRPAGQVQRHLGLGQGDGGRGPRLRSLHWWFRRRGEHCDAGRTTLDAAGRLAACPGLDDMVHQLQRGRDLSLDTMHPPQHGWTGCEHLSQATETCDQGFSQLLKVAARHTKGQVTFDGGRSARRGIPSKEPLKQSFALPRSTVVAICHGFHCITTRPWPKVAILGADIAPGQGHHKCIGYKPVATGVNVWADCEPGGAATQATSWPSSSSVQATAATGRRRQHDKADTRPTKEGTPG